MDWTPYIMFWSSWMFRDRYLSNYATNWIETKLIRKIRLELCNKSTGKNPNPVCYTKPKRTIFFKLFLLSFVVKLFKFPKLTIVDPKRRWRNKKNWYTTFNFLQSNILTANSDSVAWYRYAWKGYLGSRTHSLNIASAQFNLFFCMDIIRIVWRRKKSQTNSIPILLSKCEKLGEFTLARNFFV